jgi:uncharacterized protein
MVIRALLILAVVFVVLWLVRGGARARAGKREPAAPPAPAPEDVVACRHCGLHLPRSESLSSRDGVFCSEAHRVAFEQTHP